VPLRPLEADTKQNGKVVGSMNFSLRTNKWSSISILTTSLVAIITYATIHLMYIRGQWDFQSGLSLALGILDVLAMLFSAIAGIVAMAKERPAGYGVVALCLSLLSFFLYVH
jgi:hypothetical protein